MYMLTMARGKRNDLARAPQRRRRLPTQAASRVDGRTGSDFRSIDPGFEAVMDALVERFGAIETNRIKARAQTMKSNVAWKRDSQAAAPRTRSPLPFVPDRQMMYWGDRVYERLGEAAIGRRPPRLHRYWHRTEETLKYFVSKGRGKAEGYAALSASMALRAVIRPTYEHDLSPIIESAGLACATGGSQSQIETFLGETAEGLRTLRGRR